MSITHCPYCDGYVSDRITVCPQCAKDMHVPYVDEKGVARTLKRESLDFPPVLQKCMDYYKKKQEDNSFVVVINKLSRILSIIYILLACVGIIPIIVYGFKPSEGLGITVILIVLVEVAYIAITQVLLWIKSPRIFVTKMQDWIQSEKIDPYEILDEIKSIPGNKMEESLAKQNYQYALTVIAQAALLTIVKNDPAETSDVYKKRVFAQLCDNLSASFFVVLFSLAFSALKYSCLWISAKRNNNPYLLSDVDFPKIILEPFTMIPILYVFSGIGIVLLILGKVLFSKKKIAEQEDLRKYILTKWMNEDYKRLRAKHNENKSAENTAAITK